VSWCSWRGNGGVPQPSGAGDALLLIRFCWQHVFRGASFNTRMEKSQPKKFYISYHNTWDGLGGWKRPIRPCPVVTFRTSLCRKMIRKLKSKSKEAVYGKKFWCEARHQKFKPSSDDGTEVVAARKGR